MCFYCTQSDILLCGIARFSRGSKNKLRTFQPQKWRKKKNKKNSQPQRKCTGFYKKRVVKNFFWVGHRNWTSGARLSRKYLVKVNRKDRSALSMGIVLITYLLMLIVLTPFETMRSFFFLTDCFSFFNFETFVLVPVFVVHGKIMSWNWCWAVTWRIWWKIKIWSWKLD